MDKEYIERGKALSDDRWNSVILSHDREGAREIILCQPAADVVEVVRCSECEHYSAQCEGYGYCYYWNYEPGDEPNSVYFNDFCSNGERRGG